MHCHAVSHALQYELWNMESMIMLYNTVQDLHCIYDKNSILI